MQAKKIATSPYFYAVLCIVVTLLLTSVINSNAQTASTSFVVCADNNTGTVRALLNGTTCKKNETLVTLQKSTGQTNSGIQKVVFDFTLDDAHPSYTVHAPVVNTPMKIVAMTMKPVVVDDDGIVSSSKQNANFEMLDMYDTTGTQPQWAYLQEERRLGYWDTVRDSVNFSSNGQDLNVYISRNTNPNGICGYEQVCQMTNLVSLRVIFEFWY